MLDWTGKNMLKLIRIFFRPAETNILIGDASKAKKILKWVPKIKFNQLVELMVDADLKIFGLKPQNH